jgi:hypothetical protein
MKLILILISMAFLASCSGATVKLTDKDSNVLTELEVKGGLRRVAVRINSQGDITIIAGQMLVSDETVQVAVQQAAQTVKDK